MLYDIMRQTLFFTCIFHVYFLFFFTCILCLFKMEVHEIIYALYDFFQGLQRVLACIVCVFIYWLLLNGLTTDICYCSKFRKFFLSFLLSGSKISTFTSKERSNRPTDKGEQGHYFHRKMKCLFQTIIVIIKFSFERHVNKN